MAEDSKYLPMLIDLVTYKENEEIVYPEIKMPPEPDLEEAPVDSSYSRKRNFFSFYSKKQPATEKPRSNHCQFKKNNNKVFNINTNRLGLVHVGWDGNVGNTTKEELIVKPKLEDISEDGACNFVPKNYKNNNDIVEEIVATISFVSVNKKLKKLKKKVTIELPSKEEIDIDRNEVNNDNSKNTSKLVVCFIEEIIIEAKRQNYSLYSNIPIAPSFPFQKISEQKSNFQTQPLQVQIPKKKENTNYDKNTFDLHSITPEKTGNFSNVEISPEKNNKQEIKQELLSENNGKVSNNNTPRGSNGKSDQKRIDGFSDFENISQKNGLKTITFNSENPFPNLTDETETMKTTLMNCINDEQNNDNSDDWVIDVKSKILRKKNNQSRKCNNRYVIVNNNNKISIEKVSKNNKALLYNSISDSDTLNKLTMAKKNYLKQNQVVTYKKMIKDLLDELIKPPKQNSLNKKGTRIYDIMPTLLILKQKIEFLCSNDLKPNKIENTKKNYKLKSYLFLVREFGLNAQTIFDEKINENNFENDFDDDIIIVDKKKFIYKYFEDYPKSKTFLHFLVNRINDIYEENEKHK